jgi:Zn-dependent protease with chaperone function
MMRTKPRAIVAVAALLVLSGLGSFSRAVQAASTTSAPDAVQAPGAPQGTQSGTQSTNEYSPPPGQYEKAVAYSSAHYRHLAISSLWAIAVPLLILRWRLAPRYRDWAERVSSRRFVQVLLYAPPLVFTLALMSLPFDLWDHSLERSFGLSVQGWTSWFGDWMIEQVIAVILGTLLIWILYGVIRRGPRRWWFYFWLAAMPVVLAVFFAQPLVIDPLFFKFTPLATAQPMLVTKLEQVVHRGGMEIPPERMFEMNASTKLTGLNAYVTGFGASKRAVIWDTTLAKASTPEVLFVFGHEMGHYVLHHIPKEITIDAWLLLGLLYVGYRVSIWMICRWGTGWGIRGVEDWASLPVLIFVLTTLTVLATPAFNAISRHFEHEADRYGLEVVHGVIANPGKVAATFFEKSGEINLADPNPSTWVKIWFFDHPTRPERVRFAATYDPWEKGNGPKYVK